MGFLIPGPAVGCIPERLHLFLREEGCRSRYGETAVADASLEGQCRSYQKATMLFFEDFCHFIHFGEYYQGVVLLKESFVIPEAD